MLKLNYKSLKTKDNIDHCLSFIKEEDQKKKMLGLLSMLDIKISNLIETGNEFRYKIWIIQKFSKRRVYIIQNHLHKFPEAVEGEPNLADVIEIVQDKRFRVANKELINLTQQLRIIGTMYFRIIVMKIGFVDKPSEKERAVITYFYGEKRGGHVIAFLDDQRKKFHKKYTASRLKKIKQFLKKLCSLIQKLIEDCRKQNESITNDDFLKKLCLPFELSIDKL